MKQRITPFLWFDSQAEEAAKYYVSVFSDAPHSNKNSTVGNISRYDKAAAKASSRPEGSVLTVEFVLDGQEFAGLNGGPVFKFSEAVSFMIECQDQEEVDYFWEKLTSGGEESQCGWLKDKFGLSWQVVPTALNEMLEDKDPAKAGRVMQAMLQMKKIDINKLKEAYDRQ